LVYSSELTSPIVLGRQSESSEVAYSHKRQTDSWRVVIARADESFVSREHIRLETLTDGKVKVANLSTKLPVRLENGPELRPESSLETTLPLVLIFGGKAVRVQQPVEEDVAIEGLAEATMAPAADMNVSAILSGLRPHGGGLDVEALV